ncbi:MAG: isoprenylcysteine carboxylmethyltransferase family protein [Clostridiales Family XIII bacterium]|jgi:protein-S-isoprenylcysteine O-methyltransferase Ste14|nr:isoprenylcysteine carboxylmethyltransferase family protein [Clostridiales Family XIII bacterium]
MHETDMGVVGVADIMAFSMLCLFWLMFLGRTAMLKARGIRVFVLGKGKSPAGRALEIVLMPALALWTAQAAAAAFGGSLIPAPLFWDAAPARWTGVALCAAGLALFAAALVSFGGAWRVGIDDAGGGGLVVSGVFSLSRNPIFLFMDIYFFGTFLIYPNWFFLAFFVCAALGVHGQTLNEERFLRSRFGAEYEAYCRRVRRYL